MAQAAHIRPEPDPQGAPTGIRNYPRNCWWVAATISEVGTRPLARWLIDIPVVLYRSEAGVAVALEDRCIHRWAPLSKGLVEGEEIICPYHGARFGPDGACTRYPTQAGVPETAKVRSFTVIEEPPFVWIWLGDDSSRAKAAPPPALPYVNHPGWSVFDGYYSVAANYALFHENLFDLTHFNTLHKESLGITNKAPPHYWAEGTTVRSEMIYDLSEKSPDEILASGNADPSVRRQEDRSWVFSPAAHFSTAETFAGEDLHPHEKIHINHFMTPSGPGATHYWWTFCIDKALPEEARLAFRGRIAMAFTEDVDMIESIQHIVDRDPRHTDYPEVSFKGDFGGLLIRRALKFFMANDVTS